MVLIRGLAYIKQVLGKSAIFHRDRFQDIVVTSRRGGKGRWEEKWEEEKP